MCSPFSGQNNAAFSLDQLLQIVSNLEDAGLLEDFIQNYPEYTVGVEVARAIIQRNRNSMLKISGPPGPAISPVGYGNASAISPIAPAERRFIPASPPTFGSSMYQQSVGYPGVTGGSTGYGYSNQYGSSQAPLGSTVTFSRPGALDSALEQKLAAIPQPCPCPRRAELAGVGNSGSCGPPGTFRRTVNSHERDSLDVKCYEPVAGSFSDGIGGHKIKCSQDSSDSKAAAARKAGNLDGHGGRKVKSVEE